jgi:mannose-6-phosphate isomerase-like protein (cupin superfamily)
VDVRKVLMGIVVAAAVSVQGAAQQAAPPTSTPPRLFTSSAELTAMIARAKSERRSDQANFTQPILQAAPYNANLEYRVAGLNANASVHEREAEMFYVVDGSGTLVTGGRLRDERRTNADNLSGSGIDGGSPRRVAKGDFAMVPEGVPHWFGEVDGALVLMSIHLPRAPVSAR